MAGENPMRTEIRELAVCLGIADTASGNGYYALGAEEGPDGEYGFDVYATPEDRIFVDREGNEHTYRHNEIVYESDGSWLEDYDQSNPLDMDTLTDGYAFADALRRYGIDFRGVSNLLCECSWGRGEARVAKDNYALGTAIAYYFGLDPGSIEKISWYGPENLKREARKNHPPVDIGIKLVGTPERVLPPGMDSYRQDRPKEEWVELLDNDYFDVDSDIMISLKDRSDVLGSMGFASFANLMLGTDYKDGTDFFQIYAEDAYDDWFDIAWDMMVNYLYDNDYIFETQSARSGLWYRIELVGDDQLSFYQLDADGKTVLSKRDASEDMTRSEWRKRSARGSNSGPARKAFSKWCTTIGNKKAAYIEAQTRCSRISAYGFAEELASGALSERFYNLVGWRMAEYFYAKIEQRRKEKARFLLCGVPTVFNAGTEFPLDVEVSDKVFAVSDVSELDEPLETQAEVPFALYNEDLGIDSKFRFVFRFMDGMFMSPPQVNIKTVGNYPGMYYILEDSPLEDFMPY